MKLRISHVLAIAGIAALLTGCGGDMAKQLNSNPALQATVMDAISQSAPMADQMMDRLLSSDSTRTLVLGKVMADSEALQTVMGTIARDQTMIDGVLNLAVQDTVMKSHLMGVLQGMKMMQ